MNFLDFKGALPVYVTMSHKLQCKTLKRRIQELPKDMLKTSLTNGPDFQQWIAIPHMEILYKNRVQQMEWIKTTNDVLELFNDFISSLRLKCHWYINKMLTFIVDSFSCWHHCMRSWWIVSIFQVSSKVCWLCSCWCS